MKLATLTYNIFISIWGVLSIPKMIKKNSSIKQVRFLLKQKLGMIRFSQSYKRKQVIWFHCVSLGETKAAEPLIELYRKTYPDSVIVTSHATLTGLSQAKQNHYVDYSFILPLDLSIFTNHLVKKINPFLFILVESDFWPNLLHSLKKHGVKIALVNGKLSNKSAKRFKNLQFLSKSLFNSFDLLVTQNLSYEKLFLKAGARQEKLISLGNLKFDIERKLLPMSKLSEFKQNLGIDAHDIVITFGCTHPKEEIIALELYQKLLAKYPNLKMIIAPRHPQRFKSVGKLMSEYGPVSKLSNPSLDSLILVDQLGVLDKIYQISDISVLCGSLVDGIGGHNLFEPLECGSLLVYGPFIDSQQEMDQLIQTSGAGIKLSKDQLEEGIVTLIENTDYKEAIKASASKLVSSIKGASSKTFEKLEKMIAE